MKCFAKPVACEVDTRSLGRRDFTPLRWAKENARTCKLSFGDAFEQAGRGDVRLFWVGLIGFASET